MRICINKALLSSIAVSLLLACQTSSKHAAMAPTSQTKEAPAPTAYFLTGHSSNSVTPKPADTPALREETEKLQVQVKSSPRDLAAQISLAQIFIGNGNLSSAEKLAQNVLNIDFRNRDAKIILAHSAYLQKRYDTAKAILRQLGGEAAPESEALNLLACMAWREKDYQTMERLLQKALKQNPNDLGARMNVGLLYLRRENLPAAEAQFKEVLKRVPENGDAKAHLGIAYAMERRYPQALELYRDALSQNPHNPLILFDLAVLQARSRDYKGALDTVKEFLALKNLSYSNHDAALALLEEIRRAKGVDSRLSSAELDKLVNQEKAKHSEAHPDDDGGEQGHVMSNVGLYN